MKNFIQPGLSLDLIAPSGGVVSGAPVLLGNILAVPVATKAQTEIFAGQVDGVFSIAKLTSDNMTVGLKVNWNDSNKELQIATSTLDNVATVVEAAAGSTTVVKVKFTPV